MSTERETVGETPGSILRELGEATALGTFMQSLRMAITRYLFRLNHSEETARLIRATLKNYVPYLVDQACDDYLLCMDLLNRGEPLQERR